MVYLKTYHIAVAIFSAFVDHTIMDVWRLLLSNNGWIYESFRVGLLLRYMIRIMFMVLTVWESGQSISHAERDSIFPTRVAPMLARGHFPHKSGPLCFARGHFPYRSGPLCFARGPSGHTLHAGCSDRMPTPLAALIDIFRLTNYSLTWGWSH